MHNIGFLLNSDYAICRLDDHIIEWMHQNGVKKLALHWSLMLDPSFDEFEGFASKYERLLSAGISIASMEAPPDLFRFSDPSGFQAELSENEGLFRANKLIRTAGKYNIPYTTLCSAGACLPFAPEKDLQSLCAQLMELAPFAQGLGVTLLLSNHYYPERSESDRCEKLLRVVKTVSHEAVKLCLDTGHANLTSAVLESYHLMSEYLVQIHLNDNMRKSDEHLQPGYGSVPWVGLGKLLRENRNPEMEMFINASFYQDVDPATVLKETKALLNGRVYTRPDGGLIGRHKDTGRIIILE